MFYCTRLAMPMIKAAGGGSIINLSSAAGRLGFPFRTPYAAAKWGVVGFTKSLSMEVGTDNIRVNAIQPGVVEGERIDRVIDAKAKAVGISFEEQKKISLRARVDAPHGQPLRHRQHGALSRERRRAGTSPARRFPSAPASKCSADPELSDARKQTWKK